MKEKDVVSNLKELGWICSKDEVGDYFCVKDIEEVKIQVIPSVGERSDHFRVSLTPSVSTKEFSEVVAFVLGEGSGYSPVIVSNEPPEKLPNFSSDDVLRMSEKAISWARSQNIESGLMVYRNLPTDAKGAMPLRHLAALAIAGDVERLEGYKKSFEMGDRLGFVPYITADMIDRAVLKAKSAE
ncbi:MULTISPECIES: hypothetical protein [Pseudomonas]|uniref:Uncharacterized protein n=1 Tax=Pseudomonas umsongensis TaxID=198618 RepID=A0ACC5MA64_9PSED|nr:MULTISPECIES: hypothetical protein [Pseudomonas]MBB2885588.1 hypothetical protein [Pseudomonas umsongensis]NMN80296.1 hypothetical protein [Pseudomonas sp. KD5]